MKEEDGGQRGDVLIDGAQGKQKKKELTSENAINANCG